MASRHEKCKESVKPTSQVVPPTRQVVQPKKQVVRPNKQVVPPTEPKAVVRATGSYTSLVLENQKLKKDLETSLAANKILEDEISSLTKREEELTVANVNLKEALETEQTNNKRSIDMNEHTKSLMNELATYAESQKSEVHASIVKMLTNLKTSLSTSAEIACVELEKIEALKGWTKIRTNPEYSSWTLKLSTNKKQKEMAKYLEENVSEETLRDTLIQSLKLMFYKGFFVKEISFGHETGRTHFKGSNLLKSLQMSLANKFPNDDTSSKTIQKKIRNFKDALSKNSRLWEEELDAETTEHNVNEGLDSSTPNDSEVSSSESAEELFCLCKGPALGEMILCDNDLCAIKWYHFPCVSIVKKPRGKWYCMNCRGGKKRG